ncbi:MAG: hypothetical protein HYX39_13675 [Bacteroidetes bacterium]|nr:hypothetical protein [Bacteroidota bacterium]
MKKIILALLVTTGLYSKATNLSNSSRNNHESLQTNSITQCELSFKGNPNEVSAVITKTITYSYKTGDALNCNNEGSRCKVTVTIVYRTLPGLPSNFTPPTGSLTGLFRTSEFSGGTAYFPEAYMSISQTKLGYGVYIPKQFAVWSESDNAYLFYYTPN